MSSGNNGSATGPGGSSKPASTRASGSHSLPPPLPPASPAEPRVSVVDVAKPAPRARGFALLAVVTVVIAGIGGALLRFKTSSPIEVTASLPVVPAPTPAPPPAVSATSSAVAPVVEVAAQIASSNDPALCIESHFPAKALGEKSDLGFVCSESDAWKIATQLGQRIAKIGDPAGLALWSHLGLYELAVAASLRSSCCSSAAPVSAPSPKTSCGSLVDQLQALGSEPNAEELTKYEKLIRCLIAHDVHLPDQYTKVSENEMQRAMRAYFPAIHDHPGANGLGGASN